jgi:hypothetical protein
MIIKKRHVSLFLSILAVFSSSCTFTKRLHEKDMQQFKNQSGAKQQKQLVFFEKTLFEIKDLEQAFLDRRCQDVLEHYERVLLSERLLGNLPMTPISQLGVSICDAEINFNSKNKIQFAIFIIDLFLTKHSSEIVNEGYLYELKSKYYENLGDSQKAIEEAQRGRNYISHQDYKLLKLDAHIIKLKMHNKTFPTELETKYYRILNTQAKATYYARSLEDINYLLLHEKDENMIQSLKDMLIITSNLLNTKFHTQELELRKLIFNGQFNDARDLGEEMKKEFQLPLYIEQIERILRAHNPNEISSIRDKQHDSLSNLSFSEVLKKAQDYINAGTPDQAIELIELYENTPFYSKLTKTRDKALSITIKNLRIRVTNLYLSSKDQDSIEKRESLLKCKNILEDIITKYPDYSEIASVENNLSNITKEIEALDRSKK